MTYILRRLPTPLEASSSSSSSCSSELDLGSYSFPNDPNQRLIVIRNRPKIYRTKINAPSEISPLPPSAILFMVLMGSFAAVLLLFGVFIMAWRRYRRMQRSKKTKEGGHLYVGGMSDAIYHAVPTKDEETGSFTA